MRSLYLLFFLLFLGCASQAENSLVYTDYGANAYQEITNKTYIHYLKKAGLEVADLLYTCFTKDSKDHTVDCDSYDSPKKDNLKELSLLLKKEGFKLTLRFYIDLKNQKWRAFWKPKETELAFKNYEKELLRFSKLASDVKADTLIVGSELEGLTVSTNRGAWEKMIRKVREVYKGRVLYAANGNINKEKEPEYKRIFFWNIFDGIGINYYPPYKGNRNESSLLKHHKEEIHKLMKFSKDQNIYLTEVGFPLAESGIETPYEWRYQKKEKPSPDLRNLSLKIFLSEVKKAKVSGVFFWRYFPREQEAHSLGYIVDESFLSLLKNQH